MYLSTPIFLVINSLEPFHMYGFFKRFHSSSMVFGTVCAVHGQIEDGTTYFWSVEPCSNWTVCMSGPDLILKFLNRMNSTEWCRICGNVKKTRTCETGLKVFSHVRFFQMVLFIQHGFWYRLCGSWTDWRWDGIFLICRIV